MLKIRKDLIIENQRLKSIKYRNTKKIGIKKGEMV